MKRDCHRSPSPVAVLTVAAVLFLGAPPAAHAHGGAERVGHEQAHGAGTDHHEASGLHRHDRWLPPPAGYARRRSNRWADIDAIKRGAEIYARNCKVCHGADGRGTGPLAKTLAHAPADLTNHFHRKPGDGDAYLFWRVSEGGTVEPFKSMGSAMPAFKGSLSEDQRWDVLAYVHAYFHLGLARWRETDGKPGSR